MRIATKIALGYSILILLMVGLLVYHTSLIRQMEAINRQLSDINFRAAITALELLSDLSQLEEATGKFVATGRPEYAAQVKKAREAFTANLDRMRALGHSEREAREVARLAQMWSDFSAVASRQESLLTTLRPGEVKDLERIREILSGLIQHLSLLRAQTQTLIQATQETIQAQVNTSTETAKRVRETSSLATVTGVLLAILISFFIVRSIADPLRQLTDGTRALAQGRFSVHLDARGRDEFAQLARDFNIMAERLDELDQMKRDFVSHVSHELKAPLASMQETIRLLLEEIPGPLTDRQRRLLELTGQSGRRLEAMISNLLDLSRMEAGVMEYDLKQHDLVGIVRAALAEFEARAGEKKLRLDVDLPQPPVLATCDGDRLHQVLTNLLENAYKFSPPGGMIGIRAQVIAGVPPHLPAFWRQALGRAGSDRGVLLLAVSDSGPGVPDAHKEKIFEKFHQVRQGKKISGQGVGLGLAICRTIVQAHQGAIWVEDNPGGGSIFYVLLPMDSVGQPAVSVSAASSSARGDLSHSPS